MRIQYKIAFLFTLLTAFVLLLLGIVIYYMASRYSFSDFYKRLELRAVIAAKTRFDPDINTVSYNQLRRRHMERLPVEQEYFLPVGPEGLVDSIPARLELPAGFYRDIIHTRHTGFHRRKEVLYAGILYSSGGKDYIVIMSANNEYGRKFLVNLRNSILISGVVFVLLSLLVSVLFARYILSPIRNITIKARDINVYNLHQRIPAANGKDEIAELSHTFNNMLDRIETAFESQNNFVSNASHELRTPLTAIIGEAEWAMSRERSADQYRHSLDIVIHEAERLQQLITSLLRLAQSGFDGYKQQWEQIRVEELLLSVKQTVDEIIPGNQVRYDFRHMPRDSGVVMLSGSSHLLHLALSNVILNACKYSRNDSVQVIIHITEDRVELTIIDKGIGIPSKDLPYIFDPFFRASNTERFEGHGIGLPLANNIVRMHKGTLNVYSEENRGVKVYISLPAQLGD